MEGEEKWGQSDVRLPRSGNKSIASDNQELKKTAAAIRKKNKKLSKIQCKSSYYSETIMDNWVKERKKLNQVRDVDTTKEWKKQAL